MSGVVALRTRALIRARWRATLALALLIGVAGGAVLAAAAGARRTGAAYDAFRLEYPGADVFLPNPSVGPDSGFAELEPSEVERLPGVAAISVGRAASSQWGTGFAAADGRFGFETPRWKIVEGRAYDPAAVGEAIVLAASGSGLQVGDVIDYPGDPGPDAPGACALLGQGPQMRLEVVGKAVMAGQFFAPITEDPWALLLTPALAQRLPALVEQTGCEALFFPPSRGMMWVRTLPDRSHEFQEALDEIGGGALVITEPQAAYDDRNRESLGLQATALWILAAAVALAGTLILAQSLSRQTYLEAGDRDALRALGASRRQLFAGGLVRSGIAVVLGSGIAVVVAWALLRSHRSVPPASPTRHLGQLSMGSPSVSALLASQCG